MRVSPLLGCMLVAAVYANELRGRALHEDDDKANSKSTLGYTKVLCMTDDCHAEKPEFEGMNMIGLCVGFAVTALFMIFGVIVIIRDEIHRHRKYKQDLIVDQEKLRKSGVDAGLQQAYDKEFFDRENAKKKTAEELEKERLELMAKN